MLLSPLRMLCIYRLLGMYSPLLHQPHHPAPQTAAQAPHTLLALAPLAVHQAIQAAQAALQALQALAPTQALAPAQATAVALALTAPQAHPTPLAQALALPTRAP